MVPLPGMGTPEICKCRCKALALDSFSGKMVQRTYGKALVLRPWGLVKGKSCWGFFEALKNCFKKISKFLLRYWPCWEGSLLYRYCLICWGAGRLGESRTTGLEIFSRCTWIAFFMVSMVPPRSLHIFIPPPFIAAFHPFASLIYTHSDKKNTHKLLNNVASGGEKNYINKYRRKPYAGPGCLSIPANLSVPIWSNIVSSTLLGGWVPT